MNMHIVSPSPSSMLAIGISLGTFLSLLLYVFAFDSNVIYQMLCI